MECIYIDICLIYSKLWGRGDERERAENLFNKLHSVPYNNLGELKVSFLTISELVNSFISNNLAERDPEFGLKGFGLFQLREFLTDNDLKIKREPPGTEISGIACEIIDKDYEMEQLDSMIVAQALCDPDSTCFLTTDDAILESDFLEVKKREMRKEGERGDNKLTFAEEY